MVAFFDYAGFSLDDALARESSVAALRLDVHTLREQIEETRAEIALSLGLPAPQIFLTMGTTRGFKQLLLHADLFPDAGQVIVSDLMYPKMYRALTVRCRDVQVAPVSKVEHGRDVADCLAALVGPHTTALVADVVDNRRGLAIDLAYLREAVCQRNPQVQIIVDASQAYGQLPQLSEASAHYDILVADIKKWCQCKAQTGPGFIAVTRQSRAEALSETANSQFALHPDWLPSSPDWMCDGMVGEALGCDDPALESRDEDYQLLSTSTIGRADAGGADLLRWSQGKAYVKATFQQLHEPNHRRALAFLGRLLEINGPWRCWPTEPCESMTGIVSLVGDGATLMSVHRMLFLRGIFCSLIPTNLAPYPQALQTSEACLRFSFHDRDTTEQEVSLLLAALEQIAAQL